MNKQISLLLLFIWFSSTVFSQDSEFTWHLLSSLGGYSYTVKIEKKNINCNIKFFNENPTDSIWSKINNSDCDSLITFLSNYSFKTKGSSKILRVIENYQETKLLNDTNWILLNGDSIRLSGARLNGLKFDKNTKKYYFESYKMLDITDGITFSGSFISNNQIKEFDIHSGRISEEDYKLNQIIANLTKKYFSTQDFSILMKLIDGAKPVQKEYQ